MELEIKFEPQDWESLKKDDRRYAECTLIETSPDGKQTIYQHTAVKLKGSVGSYQKPDARPGLTLSMDQFKGADRFHGMDKFHLNNGQQDPSFMHEWLAGEWSRLAGVPASRCTHVLLKWNGRDLGLYLFKESFTKDFLSYFYEQTDGSLYDGKVVVDVDGKLEKQQGKEGDDSDVKALVAAAKEQDPKVRWQKLYEKLDVDEFLRALAVETFTEHFDGYNFHTNNYRLYFDPKTGKANFFCHGMDQTFVQPNWPVMREPGSLIGRAVWSNPDWKAHYRKLAEVIYQKVVKGHDWEARILAQGEKILEAMRRRDPNAFPARQYESQIEFARAHILPRIAALQKEFSESPASPWQDGVARLDAKSWRNEGGGGTEINMDGQKCLVLRAQPNATSSWRQTFALPAGRYRFEARLKVASLEAPEGEGVSLSLNGAPRPKPTGLKGTSRWQKIAYEFDTPAADVTLLLELRATKGEAWFQTESLQVVKVK